MPPGPCRGDAKPCIAAGIDGVTWYTASAGGGTGTDPIWPRGGEDGARVDGGDPAPPHHLLVPLKEPDLVLRLFLASRAIDAESDGRDLVSGAVRAKVTLRMHQLLEGEVLEGWLPLRSAEAAVTDPFDIEAVTHAPSSAVWHKCAHPAARCRPCSHGDLPRRRHTGWHTGNHLRQAGGAPACAASQRVWATRTCAGGSYARLQAVRTAAKGAAELRRFSTAHARRQWRVRRTLATQHLQAPGGSRQPALVPSGRAGRHLRDRAQRLKPCGRSAGWHGWGHHAGRPG